MCVFVALSTSIWSSVVCPAIQYFPTLSHKRHDFRGEKKSYGT